MLNPRIPDQKPPITNLILYGSSNQNIKEIQDIKTIADKIDTKITNFLKVIQQGIKFSFLDLFDLLIDN